MKVNFQTEDGQKVRIPLSAIRSISRDGEKATVVCDGAEYEISDLAAEKLLEECFRDAD
jgi:hypothetical protein